MSDMVFYTLAAPCRHPNGLHECRYEDPLRMLPSIPAPQVQLGVSDAWVLSTHQCMPAGCRQACNAGKAGHRAAAAGAIDEPGNRERHHIQLAALKLLVASVLSTLFVRILCACRVRPGLQRSLGWAQSRCGRTPSRHRRSPSSQCHAKTLAICPAPAGMLNPQHEA